MAVAYRSSSSAATGASGGTSLTVSAPTGLASGDVLLAVIAVDYQSSNGTFTVTAPTGWSSLNSQLNITGPISGVNGTESSLWTFWYTAGGSEPSSYKFNIADGHGTNATASCSMAAFSGAGQTDTGTSTTTGTSGSTLAVSGVGSALASDMVVLLAGGQDNVGQSTGSMSITGPSTSGWTSVAAAAASASFEKLPCVTAIAYQTGVTTGATFTYSGSAPCAKVATLYSNTSSASSGTSVTVTPTANANAGDTLIMAVSTRITTAGTTITVTDTKSNTWTTDVGPFQGSNNWTAVVSTRQNGGALTTSDTITLTFSNAISESVNINLDEFYGLATSSYTDGTANNASATTVSTPLSCGSITPTQNGDLMIAVANWQGAVTPTVNTSGTVGTYTTTAITSSGGTAQKTMVYGYQVLSAGNGTAQQFDSTSSSSSSFQGVSVAYKTVGSYNMLGVAVAININATLISASDSFSGSDAVGSVGIGNGDVASGVENAVVVATVGGAADTGSGADSGTSVVPIGVSDSVTAVDTAHVTATVPATDTAHGVEVFQILSGGATLAFGNDAVAAVDSGASQPTNGQLTETGTFHDSATIAIQGPIPSGYQRIIYVLPEQDISE